MENMSLNFLTAQQVKDLLREELKQFFKVNSLKAVHQPPDTHIVDLGGLIAARPFIGSKSTIYKKVSNGEIPHSKSGKKLIFDLAEVDKWLLSNSTKTPAEIEAEAERYMSRTRGNKKGGRYGRK